MGHLLGARPWTCWSSLGGSPRTRRRAHRRPTAGVASAIAAGWHREQQGTWLVFDLGGGTLDVSLLETKDGRLRVIDHSGDNFLGGKDIDQVLVDWALSQLAQRCELGRPDRSTAKGRRLLAKGTFYFNFSGSA